MDEDKVKCIQCGSIEDKYYCLPNIDGTWTCENCYYEEEKAGQDRDQARWYHSERR